MIPAFERSKTVHALGCAASVIGQLVSSVTKYYIYCKCIVKIPVEYGEASLTDIGSSDCYDCAAGTSASVSFVKVCFWEPFQRF
jgi:hypothetical protein